jgi:hypothetical protein
VRRLLVLSEFLRPSGGTTLSHLKSSRPARQARHKCRPPVAAGAVQVKHGFAWRAASQREGLDEHC